MAILLEPPIVKPSVMVPEAADQLSPRASSSLPPTLESYTSEGSSLDGLLIWICINCGLLLFGMHVYELFIWIRG